MAQQQLQREVLEIAAAYAPQLAAQAAAGGGPAAQAAVAAAAASGRFTALFLNVLQGPGAAAAAAAATATARPPEGIDELRWRRAVREAVATASASAAASAAAAADDATAPLAPGGGPGGGAHGGGGDPDQLPHMVPVAARGFAELLARARQQEAAVEENRRRLCDLRALAHRLEVRQREDLRARAAAAVEAHGRLASRLLAVCRCVDGLEARAALLAPGPGGAGPAGAAANATARAREQRLSAALSRVEAALAPGAPGGLPRRLEAVASAARLGGGGGWGAGAGGGGGGGGAGARAGNGGGGGGNGGGDASSLDGASLERLFGVLQEHATGLERLQEVLRRDLVDLSVVTG